MQNYVLFALLLLPHDKSDDRNCSKWSDHVHQPVLGGHALDKKIFEHSVIIEYLEPHDDAMIVDNGFLIDDIHASLLS